MTGLFEGEHRGVRPRAMVLAVRADHLDILRSDVRFFEALAQRPFDRCFIVGDCAARNAPSAAFRAPLGAMLHGHMRDLARGIPPSEQDSRGTVRTPMPASACAGNPTVTGLVHVLHRRRGAAGVLVKFFRIRGVRLDIPQICPADIKFADETTQQRQADADDTMRVAIDPVDERAAETLQRERPGYLQRLAGSDVAFNVLIGVIAEIHDRTTRILDRPASGEIDDAMTGPQLPAAPAHTAEAFPCRGFVMRLAIAFTIEQKHRITTDNQRARAGTVQPLTAIDRRVNRLDTSRRGDTGKIAGDGA